MANEMNEQNNELTIEQSFEQLDQIIGKMQSDQLTLEETFHLYKKGLALVEGCSSKIRKIQCDIERINAD